MHVLIKIPHEYEDEFITARYKDFLIRFIASKNCFADNYEIEMATMLANAFDHATLLPDNIVVRVGIPKDIMPQG